MNLKGGTLIANPIPSQYEIERENIEPAIEKALLEATNAGVHGKELTPFLLKHLNTITGGMSQKANKQLVLHNAAVAAQISSDLSALRKKHTFIAL
jgi:pseudouridine-5'-phosphate glycosidase